MMTPKENLLAFYRCEPHDGMPMPGNGEYSTFPACGIPERPPFNQGGRDWFGCLWECMDAGGPAPDINEHVLDDICDWREIVKFPDLDSWDWEKALELDKIPQLDRENNALTVVLLNGLWERTHVLMGFENALCSILEDPEELEAFYDAMTDFKIKLIDKVVEYYKPDVINFHDDWGTQNGPFFDPNFWREVIKPRQKKIVEATHKHGVIFYLHSCGKYDELIPEIEEIGVDVLNCMDINDISEALKNTTKLAFVVSVHQQEFFAKDTAGVLTEDYVRNTISKEFAEWAPSGRYMAFARDSGVWYEGIVIEELQKAADYTRQFNQ